MRDVAVVAVAQHQESAISTNEVELMVPLVNSAKKQAGLTQTDIGFTCSGSSDYLAGQAFSFVMTLDSVAPVPPISESHLEMDGAWAMYEAWVKLQIGEIDTALVYSYGKSSPGSLRDVLAAQLDPYYVAPLWPDAFAIAALQARILLESGQITAEQMAEVAVRSQAAAKANPRAVRSGDLDAAALLAADYVADPLRPHDLPARADGGVAIILAAGDAATKACERPAWISGIDHRIDPHTVGARDLTSVPSAALAGQKAGVGNGKLDVAELDAPFTFSELLLADAFGLGDDVSINPSGGSLNGHTLMAAGLMRVAEVATRIHSGDIDRGLAHASSGPMLQQNLACVLEAK